MGERTSYTNGTFSWVDNVTTDQERAKTFYSHLFGWSYDDRPTGDDVVYSMAQVDGHAVAAIAPQMQDERQLGVPPHWNNYVSVDDVDGATAKAADAGATVHAGPFDVLGAGRMSALSDPTGAVFYLWQARDMIGAGLVNAPGAFSWNELNTRDPEAAERFYSDLFGWTFTKLPIPDMDYWTIANGDRQNGGMRVIGDELPAEVPAHWLPYFAVDSIEDALERARHAGGTVAVAKTQANEGNYFAVLMDPLGSPFALFEGTLDD